MVCLDESFFIDDNYQLTTFTFGSQVIELFCLHSASSYRGVIGNDQDAWNLLLRLFYSRDLPYDTLFYEFAAILSFIIECWTFVPLLDWFLYAAGITGILCSRFCCQVVLTDHNEEVLKILKKNVEFHSSSQNDNCCAGLATEKLEWGNSEQICHISRNIQKDLILFSS
ncbi:hypothetical protein FNV43_RR03634 [Rhamnella rubrinervis]|uniref:Uncharacterized protein n=1 Tax=Rhamnella rubrinervis TaxID=2594499 RepID=A0A8K0HK67_9ROSA|nr:hypothetical protein FNV43_RR03634 [Rhamnella rubrinervis]